MQLSSSRQIRLIIPSLKYSVITLTACIPCFSQITCSINSRLLARCTYLGSQLSCCRFSIATPKSFSSSTTYACYFVALFCLIVPVRNTLLICFPRLYFTSAQVLYSCLRSIRSVYSYCSVYLPFTGTLSASYPSLSLQSTLLSYKQSFYLPYYLLFKLLQLQQAYLPLQHPYIYNILFAYCLLSLPIRKELPYIAKY